MRLTRRAWLGWTTAAGLTGCQSLPVGTGELPLRHSGRLAVQVAGDSERSFSAGFELAGDTTNGRLALLSPLGTQHGLAVWSPGSVRLVTGDGIRRYATLDALSADLLGEPVPIAALFDWLGGRPWPAAAAHPLPDGTAGFAQEGWQVALQRLADGLVVLSRTDPAPVVTVRIKLDAR